jgi:Uncharacterized protein conserved in bacteria (DUF2188)
MEKTVERAKRPAPTRPDPKTLATSPGSVLIGVIGGVAGLIRNTIFGRRNALAKRPVARKPSGGTSAGSQKTGSTRNGSSTGPVIHVTADPNGGWRAVRSGASKALARSDSKQEVVSRARETAKSQAGRLVVHKQNGSIQEERTYG